MKPIIFLLLMHCPVYIMGQEKQLEIEGAIKIGHLDEESPDPLEAGTIRWNPTSQDFEGWNGTEWKSLTLSASSLPGPSSWAPPTTELCRLTATDGDANDEFGGRVDIDKNVIVVGANDHDTNGNSNQGKAYIFERNGECWLQISELTALGSAADDRFGLSVAISDDVVIVGAPFHNNDGNSDQGKAYIYVKPETGWPPTMTQTTTLISNDGNAEDQMGMSVDIWGDVVIVGAPNHDLVDSLDHGKVYVFQKPTTGWPSIMTQSAILLPTDGASEEYFGSSISIFEDQVAVGAYKNTNGNYRQGIAYIFEKPTSGWSSTIYQSASLISSDGEAEDFFGARLSISADVVAVASQKKKVNGNVDQGQVYLFAKPVAGWSGTISEISKLIASDGTADDIFGTSVSISDHVIVVGAPWHDSQSNDRQGKTYIYEKPTQGWPSIMFETLILRASDGEAVDQFGINVAIDENVIVVGAFAHDVNENQNQGQAYIFVRNGLPSSN